MKKITLILLMIILIICSIKVKAETTDITPPVISSITANKTEYNAGDTVSLNINISDDISGIYFATVIMAPKDDINNLNHLIRISKSNLPNGTSVITGDIAPGAKEGKYVIRMIQVSDWGGNIEYFVNDNVSTDTAAKPLTFKNVEINVTNNITDKTAPVISNININKNQFNVGETFKVTMEIDDESPIKYAGISGDYGHAGFSNVQGNVYEAIIKLKKPGNLKFYVIEVTDIYNNSKRYVYKSGPEIISPEQNIIKDKSLDITVIGEEDKTAPTIKSVEISKKEVKLPSKLEIKVNYKDNKANDIYMSHIEIYDVKTKKRSKIYCTDGIRSDSYSQTCVINLKQYEDIGEYYVGKIYLEDNSNNISEYLYENNTLDYYSFKIIADTNSDNASSTISDKVDEVIINSKDDAVISIDSTRNKIVKKSIFDNIKGTNKTIIIESNGIQWIFNGSSIVNETKDINTEVNFYKLEEKNNKITDKIKKPTLVVSFASNGLLPGKCKVRIKADYTLQQYLGKEKLYVYYYNETEEQFSNVASKIKLTKDGYYEFYITHNSTYILTNDKPSSEYITKNDNAITYNENINDDLNITEDDIDVVVDNNIYENSNINKEVESNKKLGTNIITISICSVIVISLTVIAIIITKKYSKHKKNNK